MTLDNTQIFLPVLKM